MSRGDTRVHNHVRKSKFSDVKFFGKLFYISKPYMKNKGNSFNLSHITRLFIKMGSNRKFQNQRQYFAKFLAIVLKLHDAATMNLTFIGMRTIRQIHSSEM